MSAFFPLHSHLMTTSSYGKCMCFPINVPWYAKMQQTPLNGMNLGNLYSYFSHSMDDFFSKDSHPMVYFIIWEMHVFSHQFPITWEKTAKPIKRARKAWEIWFPLISYKTHHMENLGNSYSYFSHSMGAFSS